jgi:Spy/CpxP family protein refolding chaperone
MRKLAMPSDDMAEKLLSREQRMQMQQERQQELIRERQEKGEHGQG